MQIIKEIMRFNAQSAEEKRGERVYYLPTVDTDRKRIPQSWCSKRESSGPSFRLNPRNVKWVTTG